VRQLDWRAGHVVFTMDDVELANMVAGISDGPVVAGAIHRSLANAIGAKTRIVFLSLYTLDKQRFSHNEIDFQRYTKCVQDIFDNGMVFRDRSRHLVFVRRISHFENFKIVVNSTKNGDELYIKSFHTVDAQEYRRLKRKADKLDQFIRLEKCN
jgi:hypothetical protein